MMPPQKSSQIPTLEFKSNPRPTEKLQILSNFHEVVAELRSRSDMPLSYARIHELMEDHLASNEFYAVVDQEPPKKRNFNDLVHARTIRNILNREVDIRATRLQHDTFLFISAFCQLYKAVDIPYL